MDNLSQEILKALASEPEGLGSKALYKCCKSAVDEKDISITLRRLRRDAFIEIIEERHGNKGCIYGLAQAIDLTDEADAWNVKSGVVDGVEVEDLDNVALADDAIAFFANGDSIDGDIDIIMKRLVSLKSRFSTRSVNVANLDVKMQILHKFSALANDEIAQILDEIAVDLQGMSHG